ncbi:MAG: class I SAM-dependent methyltransferase [Methylobacteriaceae bacterium]|nr:class I SAM-dependent methyltransferase [Methylobacteriaceae bacterium]
MTRVVGIVVEADILPCPDAMNMTTGAMSENAATRAERRGRAANFVLGRFARALSDSPVAFDVHLPDGSVQHFGRGPPSFRVALKNENGIRALTSFDEGRIGDAYLAGDLDIDGDMLSPFRLRESMGDFHLLTSLWRFAQPLLFGQMRTNKGAISSHYDIDPDFFLSFLDPKTPCYTQGVYLSAEESLDVATLRKFDYCFDRLRLKPGDRILEVGPGWGAWFEYASARGVKCTGISISQTSIDYLNGRAKHLGYDWELVYSDFLNYETQRKYDAIVIMGVIEHLPQYDRVAQKFASLLKPDGNIFLDGSACTKKYELSSFMVKHIYPGNHSFLVLHDFLAAIARTPLRPLEICNDRYSYFLTFQQWARNFDRNRDEVIGRFGEFNYRRFRLYLWGAAYEFLSRSLDCYRMILHNPGADAMV